MSKSKNIVITGGSRGLGKETALKLSGKGNRVFVIGLKGEFDDLKKVAADCGDPRAWAVADVRSLGQLQVAMAKANSIMGSIDVVMCNAGIARQMTTEDPMFIEELQTTLDVNLIGSVKTVHAALPYMTKGGYVFQMSSAAAYVSAPMIGAYNASKAAVRAFAETLRVELKPRGIKVGIGVFTELKTDMTRIGFDTSAGSHLLSVRLPWSKKRLRAMPVAEVEPAIKAIVRCIERQGRQADSPRRVQFIRLFPWVVQRGLIEPFVGPRMRSTLERARNEVGQRTTELPPVS